MVARNKSILNNSEKAKIKKPCNTILYLIFSIIPKCSCDFADFSLFFIKKKHCFFEKKERKISEDTTTLGFKTMCHRSVAIQ